MSSQRSAASPTTTPAELTWQPLRRQGLRTVLLFGPPEDDAPLADCDAVVVALKVRALDAVAALKSHWRLAMAGLHCQSAHRLLQVLFHIRFD